MSAVRLDLDPAASSIVVRTFAEGLLSRLAHDLAIEARDVTGHLEGERVLLEVPTGGLAVLGAVKRGRIDPGVLSGEDREAIEAQLRGDVLGPGAVRVEGAREGGRARLTITTSRGAAAVTCDVTARAEADAHRDAEPLAHAEGRCDLSMRALGIPPVKGPLGAFRLSDRVEVEFRLVFRGRVA